MDANTQEGFSNGALTQQEYKRLPEQHLKDEYLSRELEKKWGKPVPYSCEECALTALYTENGYITDEEIIEATGLEHM
jgi:hypothetical protein